MDKQELRTRVEAELLTGATAQDLADKYGVAYVTINSWKKKLLSEQPTADVSALTNVDTATLEMIKAKAKEEAPIVAGKIDTIIDGIIGLKELEPEFHTAMMKAVKMASAFLDAVDDEGESTVSVKEWQMITNTLGAAYGAIFNKAGTVVNVAQTNVSSANENLAFFKLSQKV